ncbi:MAG: hypothetical protein EA385_15195 [Salinarimonadaceae bacterium]|nr:MAG: hypothetical protein EA385_15195 [Salinarimonadaceae bacterium]
MNLHAPARPVLTGRRIIQELAALQDEVAGIQSRIAGLINSVAKDDAYPDPASAVPCQEETRTLVKDAADLWAEEGSSGSTTRDDEHRSAAESAEEPQGRNEPASGDPASGALAGEGDEGSEPAPAARDTSAGLQNLAEAEASKPGRRPPRRERPDPIAMARRVEAIKADVLERNTEIAKRLVAGEEMKAIAEDMGVSIEIVRRQQYLVIPRAERAAGIPPAKSGNADAGHDGESGSAESSDQYPGPRNTGGSDEVVAPPTASHGTQGGPGDKRKATPGAARNRLLVVADGVVHGPRGIAHKIDENLLPALAHMADGNDHTKEVLSDIAGLNSATLTYFLNTLRPKFADIGLEIFQVSKGVWRCRRLGE